MSKTLRILSAALMTAFMAALTAAAQPPEGPPPPGPDGPPRAQDGARPRRPQVVREGRGREVLEQVMVARLSDKLGLTDEQSVLLVRRFTRFRSEQQQAQKERAEAMKALREALHGEGQEPDEEAVAGALRRVAEATDRIAAQRRGLQETMGEGLTVVQKGRMLIFLEEFEGEMRELIKDAREGRFPRGLPGQPQPGMPPMGPQPNAQPMGPQPGMPPMGPQPNAQPMGPQPGKPPMGPPPGNQSGPRPPMPPAPPR